MEEGRENAAKSAEELSKTCKGVSKCSQVCQHNTGFTWEWRKTCRHKTWAKTCQSPDLDMSYNGAKLLLRPGERPCLGADIEAWWGYKGGKLDASKCSQAHGMMKSSCKGMNICNIGSNSSCKEVPPTNTHKYPRVLTHVRSHPM